MYKTFGGWVWYMLSILVVSLILNIPLALWLGVTWTVAAVTVAVGWLVLTLLFATERPWRS